MKKLLALALFLALMLPACAPAIAENTLTITHSSGAKVEATWEHYDGRWLYNLTAGESYTMSGSMEDGVLLMLAADSPANVGKPVSLTMDGAFIGSMKKGIPALEIDSDGAPLDVTLADGTTNELRAAFIDDTGSACLSAGSASVTIGGSGTLATMLVSPETGADAQRLASCINLDAGSLTIRDRATVTAQSDLTNAIGLNLAYSSLTLEDKAQLAADFPGSDSIGVSASAGRITVRDQAKLNAAGGSHGVNAVEIDLHIEDSASLIAAGTRDSGYGLFASDSTVNISGNGDLSASASLLKGCGMSAENNSMVNVSGGTLRVSASDAAPNGLRVSSSTVNVSGGTLTVSGISRGLLIENGNLTVSGGMLSASVSYDFGCALFAENNSTVTVSGGTLSASASGAYGCGIDTAMSTVSVCGGKLSASASGANGHGLDINSGTLNVSGGELNASAYGDYGYGLYTLLNTLTVSDGTLSASAYGMNGCGMYISDCTADVSGGELRVATKGTDSRSLYMDRSTANVSGGELSVSAEGMHSTGVFAEHGAALNVTGGSMTVQAPKTEGYGLHLDASLLTVGAEGNFDAYGAESAFQPVSGRIVEVQGEGRDIYGRDSQGEDWAVYTYGKKYAKVLPEYSSPNALPKTGDPSMPGAWACVMLSALGALALMKMRRALR